MMNSAPLIEKYSNCRYLREAVVHLVEDVHAPLAHDVGRLVFVHLDVRGVLLPQDVPFGREVDFLLRVGSFSFQESES